MFKNNHSAILWGVFLGDVRLVGVPVTFLTFIGDPS